MKNIILSLIPLFTLKAVCFSQMNFEGVVNQLKTKDEYLTLNQKYINDCWGYSYPRKSTLDGFQLEGITKITIKPYVMSKPVDFFYSYNCNFIISEKLNRLIINNIKFISTTSDKYGHCDLNPSNNYEVEVGCLSNNKYSELIGELQGKFNSIINSYENFLKTNNTKGIPNESKYEVTNTNNLLYYSSKNLIESSDYLTISDHLFCLGILSAVSGSLISANNPKLSWFLIGVGGVCNITSIGFRYKSHRRYKLGGIALKNYSKKIK